MSGEIQHETRKSLLSKEMEFYEGNMGMEELDPHGDRLDWWKKHEQVLPLLSKVAKHVLGIPCSSAKSERIFSTGAMMVTKRRNRLGAQRIENLLVIKENKKLVEAFKQSSERNVDPDGDAFKAVEVETNESQVIPPPISDLFVAENDGVAEDFFDDSEDDDFEVVLDSIEI